jgi:hypothetical protein
MKLLLLHPMLAILNENNTISTRITQACHFYWSSQPWFWGLKAYAVFGPTSTVDDPQTARLCSTCYSFGCFVRWGLSEAWAICNVASNRERPYPRKRRRRIQLPFNGNKINRTRSETTQLTLSADVRYVGRRTLFHVTTDTVTFIVLPSFSINSLSDTL